MNYTRATRYLLQGYDVMRIGWARIKHYVRLCEQDGRYYLCNPNRCRPWRPDTDEELATDWIVPGIHDLTLDGGKQTPPNKTAIMGMLVNPGRIPNYDRPYAPGPWRVDDPEQQLMYDGRALFSYSTDEDGSNHLYPSYQVEISRLDDYGHNTIATVLDDGLDWLANARLIAAAPDMLDTLCHILPAVQKDCIGCQRVETVDSINHSTSCASIRKAVDRALNGATEDE